MTCDNTRQAHDPITIDDGDALRVYCHICHSQFVIRKDLNKGVPDNRTYSKIFKRDYLQGNDNLLYKYHPELMSTL